MSAENEESKGLPMTAKWDPEKLAQENQNLRELAQKPFFAKVWGYLKRTGPGLLQSAMTLGAGSAAASVVAGASFGYKLLWVQPLAMLLGVCMLAALSKVILTKQEKPYKAFWRELGVCGPVLVFLWALGTISASVIWHFPQYGLAAGAVKDLASLGGEVSPGMGRCLACCTGLVILVLNVITVWSYGSSRRGIKFYETFLRVMICLVILSFAMVVCCNWSNIHWGEMGRGFLGLDSGDVLRDPQNLVLVLGMLGAAVGINMTFLYPYSLLAKGWGEEHKTLAKWDLGMSMFIPFVLVTSLIMLAMTVSGVYSGDMLRSGLKPLEASKALVDLIGPTGRVIFDLGLIGMACGAISAHMVVCGFTLPEMFGWKYTKWSFRLSALLPTVGVFGVVTQLPFWFPIFASAICFTMLPIAYLIFLIMSNKRSYLGEAVGSGPKHWIFNCLLVLALLMATIGGCITIKNNVIAKLSPATAEKIDALFGIQAKPATEAKPADEAAPADEAKPADEAAPTDEAKPADEVAPTDEAKPADEAAPTDEAKPADEVAPTDEAKPADEAVPTDEAKPADEAVPADEVKPADETAPVDAVPTTEPAAENASETTPAQQ